MAFFPYFFLMASVAPSDPSAHAPKRSVLGFLLFLFGGVVSEEVKLNSTVVFLRRVRFRQDMICYNIHTADKQILVHDPVEEF